MLKCKKSSSVVTKNVFILLKISQEFFFLLVKINVSTWQAQGNVILSDVKDNESFSNDKFRELWSVAWFIFNHNIVEQAKQAQI